MSDKVLLLGGAMWAENSFKAIRELGIELVLTDINPNCLGRRYSDHFFNLSATNTNAILKAISGLDSIAIAYCGNDFGAKSAHLINEAIHGRKLMDVDPVVFIDKKQMKGLFHDAKVATAVGDAQPIERVRPDELNYPLIFKPLAASGAIGVRHIIDARAAQAYLDEHRNQFGEILVEEVIKGTQHDVNGFFVNGHFHRAGISDRFFADYPLCYPIYGYSPSELTSVQLDECYALIEKIGRAAGIRTGPLKGDVFVGAGNEVYATEVCLRFHGDIMSSIVLPNTGLWFPLLQYIAELIPSRAEDIRSYLRETYFSRAQTIRWDIIRFLPGVFRRVANLDSIRCEPGVVDLLVRKEPGSILRAVRDNTDMLGYFIVRGQDVEQCASISERVHGLMKVEIG